ncbi:MAG: alpha/beta hydrolase [Aerococcaceae bacterium]|nr:alpha/beta hydrolase [Aerococcaceae bacterium]
MIKTTHILWQSNEYDYAHAIDFVPNVVSYCHDDARIRPAMLILPGGGYGFVSPSEAEIVAKAYYERGFNAFVCTYTTNFFHQYPLQLQPLKDVSRATRFIRKKAAEFNINPQQIVVAGFSAGGHLAGSLAVHYADMIDEQSAYQAISNRPDAVILAYPVITSGTYTHQGSMEALLGTQPAEQALHYMSLEHHVTAQTPPSFIWHTADDSVVPVQNSYLYAEACLKAGVSFAHHVFTSGIHGLSLATDEWANQQFGELYTRQQWVNVVNAIGDQLDPQKVALIQSGREYCGSVLSPNANVAAWFDLSINWLQQQLYLQDL